MEKPFDFRIVQMHLTDKCNLRCSYCYEDRAKRSSSIMPLAQAQEIAARHLTEEGSHKRVEFDFIGGEPLIAWDRIVGVVEFVHQHSWPRDCSFSFSTNGTLFNSTIKEWLDRHSCVAFSFSIDGTRAAHDLNRCGSYARVIQHVPWALERCKRFNIEPRVKMTIGPDPISMLRRELPNSMRWDSQKWMPTFPTRTSGAMVWNPLSPSLLDSWRRYWSFTSGIPGSSPHTS